MGVRSFLGLLDGPTLPPMRTVVAIATLLLAVGCTSHSSSPTDPGEGVPVVVTKQDIAPGQRFNPLIRKGVLSIQMVPNNRVVQNAAVDVGVLRGLKATAAIYQNEQIPAGRTNVEAAR